MRASNKIEKLIQKINVTPDPQKDKEILDDILIAQEKTKKISSVVKKPILWSIIMNQKMPKFSAAVILIGLFVGYLFLNGSNSVVWAEVAQRVAAVRGVSYKANVKGVKRGQAYEMQIEAIQADDYGSRLDVYMGSQLATRSYSLVDEKSHVTLFPAQKKYMEVELTEKIQRENGDPRLVVEAFLQGDYTELGTSTINGIAVEGIESLTVSPDAGFPGGSGLTDSVEGKFYGSVVGRLWVDVETGWPIEVTLDITDKDGSDQMTVVVNDFQWDAEIDGNAFVSVIPEDYTLMYTIKAGRLESGEQIVEGLAYFAKLNGGKYPAKLTIGDILGEVDTLYKTLSSDPSFQIDDVQIVNLKYGAQYFSRLQTQNKEPVYSGATVTAENPDKVLLRWKLDSGQYRVIFGDLRIEDVSPERLAELETE